MNGMDRKWLLPKNVSLWGCYGLVLCIMWTLKYHYSRAAADDLVWILTPVASIVQAVDSLAYTWEAGVGWMRSDGFIIIAPACAGVNFLIMLFGLSTLAFLHRLKGWSRRFIWIISAILGAYCITIGVNSLRIWASIISYEHELAWQWFTPERLHRIIGVAVYFPVLGLNYILLDRIMIKFNRSQSRYSPTSRHWPWQPLCWYVAGTVLVPWLHAAYGGNPRLSLEYCLTVIGVSTLMWSTGFIGWQLKKKESPCGPSY